MRTYKREKYNLKAYKEEKYRLDIFDPNTNTEHSKYGDKWETLYMEAKVEVEKGKNCELWELKYEFIS